MRNEIRRGWCVGISNNQFEKLIIIVDPNPENTILGFVQIRTMRDELSSFENNVYQQNLKTLLSKT